MSYIWLTRILLFAVVLVAARKGDEPERLTAAVLLSTFVLDLVNHAVFGDPVWYAVNPGHVVIDSWAFCALLSIALYANRGWPLLVGAGQMIVMVGHVTKLWDLTMARRAYWVLTQMPFLLQLMVLLIGTLAHMNRERRIGPYQCWRWV